MFKQQCTLLTWPFFNIMLQRGDLPILNDPITRRSWYSPGCGVCGLDIASKTHGIVMNERTNRVKRRKSSEIKCCFEILSSGLKKLRHIWCINYTSLAFDDMRCHRNQAKVAILNGGGSMTSLLPLKINDQHLKITKNRRSWEWSDWLRRNFGCLLRISEKWASLLLWWSFSRMTEEFTFV